MGFRCPSLTKHYTVENFSKENTDKEPVILNRRRPAIPKTLAVTEHTEVHTRDPEAAEALPGRPEASSSQSGLRPLLPLLSPVESTHYLVRGKLRSGCISSLSYLEKGDVTEDFCLHACHFSFLYLNIYNMEWAHGREFGKCRRKI